MPHKRRKSDYGQKWAVAVALLDKPCSLNEIEEHFSTIARRFGFFNINDRIKKHGNESMENYLESILSNMQDLGWVIKNNDLFSLTDTGKKKAKKAYEENRKFYGILKKGLNSNTVSSATFIVHLFLSLVKLPAAVLSGSVGLLNDALDTLADTLSSLFVWVGIRKKKEQLANTVLVILMLVTGGFTLYKAILQAINPVMPQADIYTFGAAVVSAVFCSVLWLYQKYAGIKSKTPALITQSVDSRNHVFASISVFAGLIAVKFNFVWLDIAVGLAVAILICKTAVELLIDLIKRAKGDESDCSFGEFAVYANYKSREYRLWMLSVIMKNDFDTENDLQNYVNKKLDTTGNRSLMAFDKDIFAELDNTVVQCISDMKAEGYIEVGEKIKLTEKGKIMVKGKMRKHSSTVAKYAKIMLRLLWYTVEFVLLSFSLRYLSGIVNAQFLWQNSLHTIRLFSGVYPIGYVLASVSGLVLYLYGRYNFTNVSMMHRHAGADELFVKGLYSKVRHPMYSMMAAIQVGIFSAVCCRWAGVLSALLFTIIYRNAVFEEKSLIESFGDRYLKYRETTKTRLFAGYQLVFIVLVILNNIAGIFGLY